MYCASGCSLRDKLSNSGACDWEARAAALPPVVYTEQDRQLSESDRQPMERQPRANPERQSRPQEQARQPGPRNQPHPRAKFDNNNRRKGPGGQRRPNEAAAAAAAAVPAAAVPVQAEGATTPATVQPDMFTAPPVVQAAAPAPKPTPAPAPAAAVESSVAESPAASD
jgi:hypothetical protein